MTITYLDTHALDADACRALAGAHPLCVGYPEGVPETWGDARRGAARTEERLAALEYRWAVVMEHIEDLEGALARLRGRQGGEADPVAYRVTWGDGECVAVSSEQTAVSLAKVLRGVVSPLPAPDPAALLGPISEPVEPRPLVEALAAQIDAMEPLVSRLRGDLAAQIEDGHDD